MSFDKVTTYCVHQSRIENIVNCSNEAFSKTRLRLRAVHYSCKNSTLGDWQSSEYATVHTLDYSKSNLAHCFLQIVHTTLHPLLDSIFNFVIYWFYNEEPEKYPNRRK